MKLTVQDIAAMTDLSAVQAQSDEEEVRHLAAAAARLGCIAVFTLPGFTATIRGLLAGAPNSDSGGGGA
jgi:deoxyribose-phosphate aldolase